MKLKALQLQELGQEVSSSLMTGKKRKVEAVRHQEKRTTTNATIQHNLRTSSRLSAARANVQPGNGSGAPSAHLQARNGPSGDLQPENGSSGASAHLQPRNEELREQEKKKVRGPTTKADIFARQNKPKLKLEINDCGQPCGPSSTEFANFIGALVRTKGFPMAHDDWRKVCPQKKYKLWTDAQLYWDIDNGSFNWFMKTAATKWREFKAELRKVFHDDMEYEELLELRDERVHEEDWKWLIDHWMSPDGAVRSMRGKANRSKKTQNHTSGSKSHARVGFEMCEELGRPARRDELFIKTHTHKNGVPHKGAETTINALKDAVRDHPELVEKSIGEGDAYFHVCGPEKNGYVRVVGLGPTPAELEMPGAKKCTSTRLQMEIEARRQSDKKVEALESRLDNMQQLLEKLLQQQINPSSTPNGSNSSAHVNRPTIGEQLENHHDDMGSRAEDEIDNMHLSDDENLLMTRHSVFFPEEPHHEEGGRDVILYNVVRPYNLPVAKGTMQTTNPSSIVGGTPLGVQYCEVVVNHVFMREAILPRPYGALKSVGDARGRSIAWPHDRIKEDMKSSKLSKGPGPGT
ncbi:uncharacterized protein LOC112895311 [Panicum hallii]|nr:uncharacterized protein LOC112895311 [Panicum hallii]